uniref:FYVE-type domain-containing protein n=1 Tax=Aegilops tauschii subsp. strangulata TaxID=200361 RepID=A0A453B301_AEGTS
METPPPFQESAHCDVCRCTFSTFRRRHHCRSCGRTLCHEHSSYHMALPQYGIYTDARVCYECFNKSSSRDAGVLIMRVLPGAFRVLRTPFQG